jgi:hypothetical protein
MSQHSLQALNTSLQAIPVALVFSKQLLIAQKSTMESKTDNQNGQNAGVDSFTMRATRLTAILKGIPGYNHGGLNE